MIEFPPLAYLPGVSRPSSASKKSSSSLLLYDISGTTEVAEVILDCVDMCIGGVELGCSRSVT